MSRNSLLAAGALALLLGGTTGAQAQSLVSDAKTGVTSITSSAQPHPDLVTPLDTFTFDIAGFNSTSGVGYILGNDQSATFGTTQTFTGAGYNGQDITIASSEAVGVTTTTDTFTVSTPTNFLTTTTVGGTKITALQFDIGDANSGVTFGGVANPVNLAIPITSDTSTGNILYNGNTSFTLTPATTLAADGSSYSAVEGVNAGTTAISTLGVHSFTYSITYATVPAPEPSQFAALGIGLLGLGGLILRRRAKGGQFA